MLLSAEKLRGIIPTAKPGWLEEIVAQAPSSGIDTPFEVASFIAQLAHESSGLTVFEENLNYSAERLPQVWVRFAANPEAKPADRRPNELAHKYARRPRELANFVYANRLGNGDEASGDGWRHRGMGPIQLTGKRNQTKCGDAIGKPLRYHPELLVTPEVGIASALWFWHANNLDAYDDDDDVLQETRLINGGEHGRIQRQNYFDKAVALLG